VSPSDPCSGRVHMGMTRTSETAGPGDTGERRHGGDREDAPRKNDEPEAACAGRGETAQFQAHEEHDQEAAPEDRHTHPATEKASTAAEAPTLV